jgi:hypothetical protein
MNMRAQDIASPQYAQFVGGGKLLLAIKPFIITASPCTTTSLIRHILLEHSRMPGFVKDPFGSTIKRRATTICGNDVPVCREWSERCCGRFLMVGKYDLCSRVWRYGRHLICRCYHVTSVWKNNVEIAHIFISVCTQCSRQTPIIAQKHKFTWTYHKRLLS